MFGKLQFFVQLQKIKWKRQSCWWEIREQWLTIENTQKLDARFSCELQSSNERRTKLHCSYPIQSFLCYFINVLMRKKVFISLSISENRSICTIYVNATHSFMKEKTANNKKKSSNTCDLFPTIAESNIVNMTSI